MKRLFIIFASLAAITACATTHAGSKTAGSQQKMTLKADRISSFATTLPVELVITDSSSPRAHIEIPSAELAEWIVCRLEGSELMIYPRDNAGRRLVSLSSANPIKVTIESSAIGEIRSTSSTKITCRNKRFAQSLSIGNTGSLHIEADKIDLSDSFYINNTGRFELDVKRIEAGNRIHLANTGRIESSVETFACRTWDSSNTGVVNISSNITADKVSCTSTGRDNLSLEIKCVKLTISSTGAGNMKFSGEADEISVVSNGSARISTCDVRQPR
ncbi:MAG: DUF2807 domain-containing protein [Alistipes sp.]|nr:DUF2807 domain-containing protein [Alistipes sp.]